MTDTTMAHEVISLEELTGMPVFERLGAEAALQPCDGHAHGGITAIVSMCLPAGGVIVLCGNCARKAGWDHVLTTPQDNRQKGSAH